MKKIIFTLMATVIVSMGLPAQNNNHLGRYFTKGQSDLQVGLGLVPVDVILEKANIRALPYTVEVKRMMGDHFSLGLFHTRSVVEGQLKVYQDGVARRLEKDFRQTGLKMAFHFNQFKNFDSYGGIALAINRHYFTVLEGDEDYLIQHLNFRPKRTGMGYTGFVGARLVARKNWTVFSEVGFGGNSFLTCGVGYQL